MFKKRKPALKKLGSAKLKKLKGGVAKKRAVANREMTVGNATANREMTVGNATANREMTVGNATANREMTVGNPSATLKKRVTANREMNVK